MRNLDEEYKGTIEAVKKSYGILRGLNPDHSLIKLLEDFDGKSFRISSEFSLKYAPRWWEFRISIDREIRGWERYYDDLEMSITEEKVKALR